MRQGWVLGRARRLSCKGGAISLPGTAHFPAQQRSARRSPLPCVTHRVDRVAVERTQEDFRPKPVSRHSDAWAARISLRKKRAPKATTTTTHNAASTSILRVFAPDLQPEHLLTMFDPSHIHL